MGMAEEKKKDEAGVEPFHSTVCRGGVKALSKAIRSLKAVGAGSDCPRIGKLMGGTAEGMSKAIEALRKEHGGRFGDHPLEDDEMLSKAFDDEDAEYAQWQAERAKGKGDEPALEIDEDVAKALSLMVQGNEQMEVMLKAM